jgi:large conductance mechanosensitive channel
MQEKSRSFFTEFKEFAMRGNVMDLAIGVVIGGAFGKIVSSLVSDLITPTLGLFIGGVDFKDLKLTLFASSGTHSVTLTYGQFLQAVFDFLIIAFALFLVIKGLNALKRRFERDQKKGDAPKAADIVLLEEIRDLLKEKRG